MSRAMKQFGDSLAVVNPYNVVQFKDQAYDTTAAKGEGRFHKFEFVRTQVAAAIYGELLASILVSLVTTLAFALASGVTTTQPLTVLGLSIAVGAIYTAVVAAFGHISGAHVNPMVSCTMFLMHVSHYAWAGGIWLVFRDVVLLVTEMTSQFIGWIIGVSIAHRMINDSSATSNLGLPALGSIDGSPISNGTGFFIEVMLFSAYLMVYVFAVVDRKLKNAPVILGATMTAVHLVGAGLTGCNLNMFRWLVTYFITGTPTNAAWGIWIFASFVPPLFIFAIVSIWRYWLEPTIEGKRSMITAPEFPPHNKFHEDVKESQFKIGNKKYIAVNILDSSAGTKAKRHNAPSRKARAQRNSTW